MPDTAPTALIADDEPALARSLAAQLAQAWPALQIVHTARQGLEAAERIGTLQPDLAFLDIQMPGLTGLAVAEGIEGPTRVVFVTAYDQYAVQAFDHNAVDYLLKPVHPDRLARTVQRLQGLLARPATPQQRADQQADEGQRLLAALRSLAPGPAVGGQPPLRWVRAGVGDTIHQVPVADVLYFQADDKYTVVRTTTAEYLIRTPIAELLGRLDPAHFCQVHRSTIVNLDHLAGIRRDATSRLWLQLHGCTQALPVSRAYVHLFRAM